MNLDVSYAAGPAASGMWKKFLAAECLVLAAAVAVCWPVAGFGYVLHDDPLEILSNPALHPFGLEGLASLWTHADFSRIYMPVSYTVFGILTNLSRWLQGDPAAAPVPAVFHVAGMLLHAVNSVLVVRLLRRVDSPRGSPAGLAAMVTGGLLFALHPVQVESYARAGNLSVTLGAFCCLASVLMFLRFAEAGGWWRFATASLFFAAGILARPQAVTLPVAAAALAWASARPVAVVIRLWPWLAVSAGFTFLSVTLQPPSDLPPEHRIAWYWRPVVAADSILWYAGQVIRPVNLSIDHGRTPDRVISSPAALLSVAGVVAATVAVCVPSVQRRWRWMAAGAVVSGSLLLPVSGLVAASRRDAISVVYDRHLYLPMAGVAIMACAGLRRIPATGWRYGIVPAAVLLALLSRQYQSVWRHSIPLFEHAVRKNPHSWYASGQLGTALLMEGRAPEAVPVLARAVAMNPGIADTRVNLGQALLESDQSDAAEAVLMEALQLAPEDPNAHNNLAVVHIRRNRFAEAENAARQALKMDPAHPLAIRNLALSLSGQKRHVEAIDAARQATQDHPGDAHAWRTLSEVQSAAGDPEAMETLERACKLAPHRTDWQDQLRQRMTTAVPGDELPPSAQELQVQP